MSSSSKQRLRGPVARHTKLRSPSIGRRILKGAALAISAVLVATVGVSGYVYGDYFGTLKENSITLEGQDTAPPDVDVLPNEEINILLAGVDKCELEWVDTFAGRCTEEMAKAQEDTFQSQLNDVNMIVHISPEPRRLTVISVPRDMMTARPSCTDENGAETAPTEAAMFNSAYSTGGLPCVVKTAEQLTGLSIDHAALMTWGGVIDITDAIGGVDVCVAQPIQDPEHTHLDLAAGNHTLAGYTALQFLRVRHGVGDGSDLSRISNQQVYMGALVRKLVSDETLSDVGALLRLANAVVKNATVSSGLTDPMAMVEIASALRSVPVEDYEFIQFPAVDYALDANRVAPDEETWQQIMAAFDANQSLLAQEDPAATETPVPEETVSPTETPAPGQVELPSNIKGSNANEDLCSNQEALF